MSLGFCVLHGITYANIRLGKHLINHVLKKRDVAIRVFHDVFGKVRVILTVKLGAVLANALFYIAQ